MPFVPFSATDVPESLIESTLYGHVKGAFTGAEQSRQGLFRAANGGTVLIDEVGDASLQVQAKLLRVLGEGVVIPVGTEKAIKVNVRVVAATSKPLEDMIRAVPFETTFSIGSTSSLFRFHRCGAVWRHPAAR